MVSFELHQDFVESCLFCRRMVGPGWSPFFTLISRIQQDAAGRIGLGELAEGMWRLVGAEKRQIEPGETEELRLEFKDAAISSY